MSDLQCPATFWFLPAGTRADPGADPGAESDGGPALLERLRTVLGATAVAGVYTGPAGEPFAAAAAAALDAPLHTTSDLHGHATDEDAQDAARRWQKAVEELADLYRGETVLVVGDEDTLRVVLPGRAAGVVRVEVDGDGWRVTERA
ncbi:MAG TPA: histidine phosphatase family protein [Segeticoccus sp.]|uniref:histidine phosphatase family protein n=1 Tax=Segeticoccus sp. TaxID=2706531 RepID=UPI002D7FA281|nr:histidine phosphatase family protein [Segeticoccus sp.]HET8601024.1 histidine phosphatase family protein [Segeticoccus sp.]